MNSLDLLIRRIKDRITVSNEDAVDTVKQYWDDAVDTVKGYWQDVDEAIVEETGIPQASLSQLLDDNRQAHSYANVGGNSGVASYDLGDDWFLVNFTTGSRYLYTTKSATREQIEEMKRYANDGKGLNSYIMRTLKTNYAGRNVKGEILIKPGMEHFNRNGHKRLQLLFAFRDTMNTQVISTEGLIADIKKFFGISNKSAKKLFIDNTFGWSVIEHIERDILRPEWLKDQTYNKGEVSGKSVLKYIGKNGKVDLAGANKQMDAFLAARTRVKKATDDWRRKTKPAADVLIQKARKLSPEVYAEAKAIMDKIPVEKYDVNYPTTPVVGNGKRHENPKRVDFVYTPVNQSIPALDESEALELAADIQRSINEFKKNMTGAPDEWPDVMHAMVYTMQPKNYGGVPYDDWNSLIWDILSPDTNETTHYSGMLANRLYWDAVVGLVRYLDVSIKGDTIISGENYTPSNVKEVNMHRTLLRYKEQISVAGQDGLDPVACQFMQAGLESMCNVLTTSLEQQNNSTTTHRLEVIIDKQLVSNEGIFDSIKKLFSGKPKPKDVGAAPEAAIEISSVDKVEAFIKSTDTKIPAKTVSKSYSALFLKGSNYNPNWLKDLTKDLTEYEKLIRATINYEKVMKRWHDKYKSQLDNFIGDADRQPEFLAVLKQYVKDQPKPWIELYPSNHDYMIFGKRLDDGEDFANDVPGSNGATEVDIPEQSAAQVRQVINKVVTVYNDLYNVIYDMGYYGADFTDPPFRGYAMDKTVVEELNKLQIHAHANNNPVDCASTIDSRLSTILSCLGNYVS